ncbi:MAG: hypothetical protein SFU25_04175 [Candidatus Caenarcaniphilales bacterium]|nr:hypothetical protein [Candidatus Caenarcaniphilales bacterium]
MSRSGSLNIGSAIKNLFLLLTLTTMPLMVMSSERGKAAVDKNNYWGHAGKFSHPNLKATYVVCNGYIGSPLIPNEQGAVETFINNCEITPPPGALSIIDVPENHSANYRGYPAYVINPPGSDHSYFVCDGFLNSTSWCSYEAHKKAVKLLRVAESRYWEPGSKQALPQESLGEEYSPGLPSRPQESSYSQSYQEAHQEDQVHNDDLQNEELVYGEGYPKKLHQIPLTKKKVAEVDVPPGYKAVPVNPGRINKNKLPKGTYIKSIPVNSIFDEEQEEISSQETQSSKIQKPDLMTYGRVPEQETAEEPQAVAPLPVPPVKQTAKTEQVTAQRTQSSEELKRFLQQAIDKAVDRAVDKKLGEMNQQD